MRFHLAHLSDPHIGPPPRPSWRELAGKRLTGYWNWHTSRHAIHNMAVLEAITSDLARTAPDHIILGGDLVNIGMAAEFDLAATRLATLAPPDRMSIVPGNHDAYVGGSLAAMSTRFGAWMTGDDGEATFPYLRMRDGVALIGLSSAIPTLPFLASGALGRDQLDRLDALLPQVRARARAIVLMIHHPPHRGGARLFRGLRDAAALEAILARHGADLIVHGHNHKHSLAHLPGPSGSTIPVVGVASASAIPGDPAHRAAYHLFTLETTDAGLRISLDVRGMEAPGDPVVLLDRLILR